jgi:hypothetical protein
LKAIEILLRKSVPDLSAMTLEGPGESGEHLFRAIERRIVRPGSQDA